MTGKLAQKAARLRGEISELEGKLNKLLIQYACKNNMAFVFIKPHAVASRAGGGGKRGVEE